MSGVQSLLLHQGVNVPGKVDFDNPTFGLKNEIKEGETEDLILYVESGLGRKPWHYFYALYLENVMLSSRCLDPIHRGQAL